MKQKICLAILSLLFVFWIQTPTQATLVKAINIQTLTGLAKYIVKAEVVGKDTMIDEDESGKIVTYYTLKIKDWIKGGPIGDDNKMVIKQLANGKFEINGVFFQQNIYFPEYEVGRTYLFFLPQPHPVTGLLAPIALSQGVYNVEKDDKGKEVMPQLKSRLRLLKKGVPQDSKNRFLNFQLNTVQQDNSYESFKSLIQSAMGS